MNWHDKQEYEELLQERNDLHISECLKGKLAPTTEEWLRGRKEA